MGKLNCCLIILLIWTQYLLWLGKHGVYDLICIYNEIQLYKDKNDLERMKIRNEQLFLEVRDLSNGYQVIEERSRYDLNMIKSDEIFYRMKR